MADEEKKRRALRYRMDSDIYGVLLSSKDGATPMALEKKMHDLGIAYNNQYWQVGVHDMEQLLEEHPQIRREGRKFKIIPTAEVAELAKMVSMQNDGHRREERSSTGSRRPRSAGSRSGSKFGGSVGRRSVRGLGAFQPFGGFGDFQPINDGFGQSPRPFQRPPLSPATFSPFESAAVSMVLPRSENPPKPTSAQPSIKEFSENAKRMMVSIHPASVHLSELIDLYAKEFGVAVDPSKLFSKSWKMLVQTTFKDWLEVDENGDVGLKTPVKIGQAAPPPTPKTPSLGGFGYQFPMRVEQQMQELSLSTRQTLPTPEKPPGITINNSTSSGRHLEDLLKPKPSNSRVPNSLILSGVSVYDSDVLRRLKQAERTDEVIRRIAVVLYENPTLAKNYTNSNRVKRNPHGHLPILTYKNEKIDKFSFGRQVLSFGGQMRPIMNSGNGTVAMTQTRTITPEWENTVPTTFVSEKVFPSQQPSSSSSSASSAPRRPSILPPMSKGKCSTTTAPLSRPASRTQRPVISDNDDWSGDGW